MADKDLHCGCLSYRKATVIVGIMQIVVTIVSMIYVNTAINKFIEANAAKEDVVKFLKTFLIILNCVLLLIISISILLIIGALKRNQCLLLPWVIVTCIVAPLGALHFLRSLFSLSSETALDTMIMLVQCVFYFYCLLVVAKYNRVLKEERKFNAPGCGTLGTVNRNCRA